MMQTQSQDKTFDFSTGTIEQLRVGMMILWILSMNGRLRIIVQLNQTLRNESTYITPTISLKQWFYVNEQFRFMLQDHHNGKLVTS